MGCDRSDPWNKELPSSALLPLYSLVKLLEMVLLTMDYREHCSIWQGSHKDRFTLSNWTVRERRGHCTGGSQIPRVTQHPQSAATLGPQAAIYYVCTMQQDFDP